MVGYHATAALVAAGHRVRALVRDVDKGVRVLGPLGLVEQDLVRGDMTDEAVIERAIEGCDAVLHSAASVSVTTGATDFSANVRGTRAVVGTAVARNLPCVYVSSLEALITPGRPTTEDSLPNGGKTHYGRSKAESDLWVRARRSEGARVSLLYPSGVVGPDDPGFSESVKAYRSFLHGMLGVGGTQIVDARDLGALIVKLLEAEHDGPVIAGGHYLTWPEMRRRIEGVTGAKIAEFKAPGWALRLFARILDVIGRITGRAMPMTGEGVTIATRWQEVPDSKAISELGIEWRPADETLTDMFRWYVDAGKLPAKAVPALSSAR